jgi:hypothetical protein
VNDSGDSIAASLTQAEFDSVASKALRAARR